MIETLSVTQILAVFIGLYWVATGVGLLNSHKNFATMIEEYRENTALGFLAGAFTFALGAAMVAVHNIWIGPLAIVVSLLAWSTLIKGALLLAFRRPYLDLMKGIAFTEATVTPYGIVIIVLGAILAIAGLV
jgi:hypothetical protein